MSSFAIMIRGAPFTSQAALSGYLFAKAVLASGHSVLRLFFFDDGVHNASALIVPPQDVLHLPKAWQALIQDYQLDAVVCVASALKRGIVDSNEAARYDLVGTSLLPGFVVGGLGQLVDATLHADRVITFSP